MKSVVIPLFISILVLLTACENVDLSKVSDKDLERISEKIIVCNEPYIRFGSSCCLDKDDNNICDRDERELTDEEQKEESEIIEGIPEEETVVIVEQTPKGNCYQTYGIRDNTVFFLYSNLDPHSRNMIPIVKDLENQGYQFYWIESSDNTKKGIVDACLKNLLSGYVPQFLCLALNKEKSGEITKTELKNFAVECGAGEPETEPPKCAIGWKCLDQKRRGYQSSNCVFSQVEQCQYGCKDGECLSAGMDLKNYPYPFVVDGKFSGIIVVGDQASFESVVGASDIANSLQQRSASGNAKIEVGATKLASEVSDIKAQNVISVGNPCENAATAEVKGNPVDCKAGYTDGKGYIELIDTGAGNVALLVAGYNSADTKAAASILSNYEDYEFRGVKCETVTSTLTLKCP